MTIIRRPSPFGELMSLRQAMDRLFEDSYVRPTRSIFGSELMPLDIRGDRDELVVEAALPGVKPDDVEITIECFGRSSMRTGHDCLSENALGNAKMLTQGRAALALTAYRA